MTVSFNIVAAELEMNWSFDLYLRNMGISASWCFFLDTSLCPTVSDQYIRWKPAASPGLALSISNNRDIVYSSQTLETLDNSVGNLVSSLSSFIAFCSTCGFSFNSYSYFRWNWLRLISHVFCGKRKNLCAVVTSSSCPAQIYKSKVTWKSEKKTNNKKEGDWKAQVTNSCTTVMSQP